MELGDFENRFEVKPCRSGAQLDRVNKSEAEFSGWQTGQKAKGNVTENSPSFGTATAFGSQQKIFAAQKREHCRQLKLVILTFRHKRT